MRRFLGIDDNLIRNPYQDDYIERLIQRLEKENEILRLEIEGLRKVPEHKKLHENFKPIRKYIPWDEQKRIFESADREMKRKKELEKAGSEA